MKVAIIIPAYNAELFLRETIESVLKQTSPAAHIVVVDDGSADDTFEVGKDFGDAVRVVQCENQGVAAARNFGAEHARGDWFMFLDADDRLRRDALKTLMARAEDGSFGVVYGKTICFDQLTGQRTEHGTAKCEGRVPNAAAANFFSPVIATAGAAIIRREVFQLVNGFAPRFSTLASRDLLIKAGMFAEFGFCDAPVIEKRLHSSNMSRNFPRTLRQTGEVQLEFLQWLRDQDLAADFPPTDSGVIIDQLLRRALNAGSLEGLNELLELGVLHGIRSRLTPRSERYVSMNATLAQFVLRWRSRLLGKLPGYRNEPPHFL